MKTIELKTDSQRQEELANDQYLFELFINDLIENQVQRMMELADETVKELTISHELHQ
jgi:hypothetical protein